MTRMSGCSRGKRNGTPKTFEAPIREHNNPALNCVPIMLRVFLNSVDSLSSMDCARDWWKRPVSDRFADHSVCTVVRKSCPHVRYGRWPALVIDGTHSTALIVPMCCQTARQAAAFFHEAVGHQACTSQQYMTASI
jgi:hypothetical protein